jgi:diguanylate cyclase (GGDEF)-like protein
VTSYYLAEATGKVEIYGVTRDISERKRAQDALFQANQQLRAQLEANQQLQVQLYEQAVHDALTGLFNRRYLEEALERLLVRAAHDYTPLSILMLDVDHFKQFNDSYGHKAGDLILRALGQLLRTYTRPSDVACRYGGEEFIVIMPDAPLEVAVVRADELRQLFADLEVQYGGTSLSATITIGVATFPNHGTDSDTLLHAADQALYAAKAAGRDLVYAAEG